MEAGARHQSESPASTGNATHSESMDDTTLLLSHSVLEAASFSTSVVNEVRRAWDRLSMLDRASKLEGLIEVIDIAARTQIAGFIAFHTLLLQRALPSTASGRVLDRTAVADRAALLRVRSVLTTSPSSARPPPSTLQALDEQLSSRSKPRPAIGVRWSLAQPDEVSLLQQRKSSSIGSSLRMHAFETLRGSIQAMEDQQLKESVSGRSDDVVYTEAAGACKANYTSLPPPVHQQRCSSLDSSCCNTIQMPTPGAATDVESTLSSTTTNAPTVTWSSDQESSSFPDPRTISQPARPCFKAASRRDGSSCSGTLRGWDAVRGALQLSCVQKRCNTNCGASICRMMASEPGAEDSDLRQLEILRQRSCSCCTSGRSGRRIAPAAESKDKVIMQHNLIGAACIHNGTPEECTAGMASQRNVNDCLAKSSADLPAVQDDIDDRPRCVDDTISTFRHDDNWNCDASCVEQSAVLLSSSAPSSATKPAAAELLAAASGAEATSARASAQPRASVLIATRQRRRSSIGDFFARPRRFSIESGSQPSLMRQDSIGRMLSRRGSVASRRGSIASRRSSLDNNVSLHSNTLTGSPSSLAAAAAFLLSDMSAEALHDVRQTRSRMRHISRASSMQPAEMPSVNNTCAVPRLSSLSALGGDSSASARLRSSLQTPGEADRRASAAFAPVADVDELEMCAGVNQLLQRRFERRASTTSNSVRRSNLSTTSLNMTSRSVAREGRDGLTSREPLNVEAFRPRDEMPPDRRDSSTAGISLPSRTLHTAVTNVEQCSGSTDCQPASVVSSEARIHDGAWSSTHLCHTVCASYDSLPLVVLHPLSRLRLYWDALVAVLSLWCLIEVPLRVVFAPEARYSLMLGSSVINRIAAVVFIMHPIVETRTIVVQRGAPEARPSLILRQYLRSSKLIIDLISAAIPLLDLLWVPLALTVAIRLIYTLRFAQKLEKATKTSPSMIRSFQIMLGALPALHWFACIFCYLSLSPGSWLETYEDTRGERLNTSNARIYLHAGAPSAQA